jgi:hypothetical protein
VEGSKPHLLCASKASRGGTLAVGVVMGREKVYVQAEITTLGELIGYSYGRRERRKDGAKPVSAGPAMLHRPACGSTALGCGEMAKQLEIRSSSSTSRGAEAGPTQLGEIHRTINAGLLSDKLSLIQSKPKSPHLFLLFGLPERAARELKS